MTGESASTPSPLPSYAELIAAIDSASIIVRESDEYGPRVAVMSHAFRGSFIYSREDATERLRSAYPELPESEVRRCVRHLESRVRLAIVPNIHHRRPSWVRDWKDL